jgi:hypothetical protein
MAGNYGGARFGEDYYKGGSDNPKKGEDKYVSLEEFPHTEQDDPEAALMRKRGELPEEEIPEKSVTNLFDNTEEEPTDDDVGEKVDFLHEDAVKGIAAEKAQFGKAKGRHKGPHGEGERPAQKPLGKPQADKRRAA